MAGDGHLGDAEAGACRVICGAMGDAGLVIIDGLFLTNLRIWSCSCCCCC